MQSLDFTRSWDAQKEGETLLRFSPESLDGVKISVGARNFLLESGLPKNVAPFFNFEMPKSGSLPLVSEKWQRFELPKFVSLPIVSEKWQLPETYNHFRIIGFNGYRDPICLDENSSGAVIYLNQDNRFERVLINSSVSHFAESLLVFRNCVQNRIVSQASYMKKLKEIDKIAWEQSAFWCKEILILRD